MVFIARVVSKTGDGHLYLSCVFLLPLLDGDHGLTFVMAGLIAFAIELPVYFAAKHAIRRDRPQVAIASVTAMVVPPDRYSFPSGHAAAAMLFATVVASYYPTIAPVALAWALMVAASRVLLSVHFLTDVLVGIALGAGAATLAIGFLPS